MNPLATIVLLILSCLCKACALPGSWSGANAVAFVPRGGAIGGGRKGRTKALPPPEKLDNIDSAPSSETEEDISIGGNDGVDSAEPTFDLQEVSKQLKEEEVAEIKKSQKFLQKQQHRKELDKTWLDKGITGVIEFFENLFRWEVIDL